MSNRVFSASAACLSVALLLTTPGCTTEPSEAGAGALRVSVSMTGEDLDLDGYTVRVDNDETRTISSFAVATFDDLPPGAHQVELSGVAENCVAEAGSSISVTVPPDSTLRVTFAVRCTATGLMISVPTHGLDPAPWLSVRVDGVAKGRVTPNSSIRVTRLSSGHHEVTLDSIPSNCRVSGSNPRPVVVTQHDVIPVSFAMSCVAATGILEVTSSTSGNDQDPKGYPVHLSDMPSRRLALNDTVRIHQIPPGDYLLRLGLPRQCTAVGGNEKPIRITAGGTTRDTVRVSFLVSCQRLWEFAFTREGWIVVASADGAVIDTIAPGWSPTWSPDGRKLAYTCGGICIAGLDGSRPVNIQEYGLHNPVWRPDGRRIAVVKVTCDLDDNCSLVGLVLMDPAGADRITLSLPSQVTYISDLDWSPNGHQLAFACLVSNRQDSDICLINADGSGFRRLTTDSASDGGPAWKPDGSAVAFHTDRYDHLYEHDSDSPAIYWQIAITGLAGDSIIPVGGPWATQPSWSPDGSQILFGREYGLYVMDADGSHVRRITSGLDAHPAWRP